MRPHCCLIDAYLSTFTAKPDILSGMSLMKQTTVVFGLDMETDVGSWPTYYRGLLEGTPLSLQILKKRNIHATFFFTSEATDRHPEVPKSILSFSKEYEIGNHSLWHETYGDPIFDIPGVKPLLPEEIPFR